MLYKTIVLELLQEHYPHLHLRLKRSRTLLRQLDRYATDLRSVHREWIASGMDPGEARELSLRELDERLAQDAGRPDP